jgi:hypothetical protein
VTRFQIARLIIPPLNVEQRQTNVMRLNFVPDPPLTARLMLINQMVLPVMIVSTAR